jgi:hypothetical protein
MDCVEKLTRVDEAEQVEVFILSAPAELSGDSARSEFRLQADLLFISA